MPIELPALDDRRWEDLRNELLARIPSHNPEWTNFNPSDPGVTLLELFAFLGESILYRANRIPERNRLAFLRLLGLPLHPGSPARALVSFRQASGPDPKVLTVGAGLELRAGKIAFHLDGGLDVLPIEALVCQKTVLKASSEQLKAYHKLYDPVLKGQDAILYETTPLGPRGLSFGSLEQTVDGAVWIGLLAAKKADPERVRKALARRVLNLGVVPAPTTAGRDLPARGTVPPERLPGLRVEVCSGVGQEPTWVPLGERHGCLERASVVAFRLPGEEQLVAWQPVELLDQGVGGAPPVLTDSAHAERLLVWLRVSPAGGPNVQLQWIGINAALATQGDRVYSESLGRGDGAPDQRFTTARRPVVPGSLRLWVGDREWSVVDDVEGAPREGAPGSEVVQVDWEAGEIRCGTGVAGERPARDALVRVSYEVNAGDAGNLGAGAIKEAVGYPQLRVENPISSWGGTASERVEDGERQVAQWLQHRDRLVSVDDFRALVRRTPGVELARVEVLAAYHPLSGPNTPGDAPGCVTILTIPPAPAHGGQPRPTDDALATICAWLEPRRLVTTELFLRGPTYVPVVVSVGIEVAARTPGSSAAEVHEAVRQAVRAALSPVPTVRGPGWPLGRPVRQAELFVVVASVPGVQVVREVLLGDASGVASPNVAITGLELPWLAAVAVAEGEPLSLTSLIPGVSADVDKDEDSAAKLLLPLPVIPDECR